MVLHASTDSPGMLLDLESKHVDKPAVNVYVCKCFVAFQRYITECVGVQYIGVAICVRGVFATLGSFGSGWLMQRTTNYMMVLVCIGGLEVGSLIFLIVWERQPSFAAIIIITAIIGLCYGLNATVGLGEYPYFNMHACTVSVMS